MKKDAENKGSRDRPSLYRQMRNILAAPPDPFLKSRRIEAKASAFLEGMAGGTVLNVGAGHTKFGEFVVNVDVSPFPTVDVVASAMMLPFRDACSDGVVAQGLLEHVPDGMRAIREIHRVLKTGGLVYAEVPFLQPFHASPSDYIRVTEVGIEELFHQQGFAMVEKGVQIGPASALAWVLREFLAVLFAGQSRWRYRKLLTIAGWMVCPLKYLDVLLERSPFRSAVASAFFYIGRKIGEHDMQHHREANVRRIGNA